jgi:hypothetical protein
LRWDLEESQLSEYKKEIGVAVMIAIVGVLCLTILVRSTFPLQPQISTTTSQAETATTGLVTSGRLALPPFANENFDVVVTPYNATVPASGGSVHVIVELASTNMTASETLVMGTRASIPGYSASFNKTSVTLSPNGVVTVGLDVSIPNGIQSGGYALSVTAVGENNVQGGGWLLINVGSSNILPPPP